MIAKSTIAKLTVILEKITETRLNKRERGREKLDTLGKVPADVVIFG